MQITPDGRAISVHALRVSVFSRDPGTGALRHRSGSCLTEIGGLCGPLREIDVRTGSYLVTPDTRIVAGFTGRGSGAEIAVLHRVAGGHWEQVSGTSGCANARGSDGCAKLNCPSHTFAVTTAAASTDGRNVYVGGGNTEASGDSGGFLASLTLTGQGGLRLSGCGYSSPHDGADGVPALISPLPHSSTVLIAQRYASTPGDETFSGARMWTAAPTGDGALGAPQQISKDLGLLTGKFILAKDGQTLYGADVQPTINSADTTNATGDLKVFGVTPTSVGPLAVPWSTPFRGRLAAGADDIVSSPDGRFVYLSTETTGATNRIFRSEPGIRVFAAQP